MTFDFDVFHTLCTLAMAVDFDGLGYGFLQATSDDLIKSIVQVGLSILY